MVNRKPIIATVLILAIVFGLAGITLGIVLAEPGIALEAIEVEKTADPAELIAPGGEVTFTVRVTNISVVDVEIVEMVDFVIHEQGSEMHLLDTCPPDLILAPFESVDCIFNRVVTGDPGYVETDVVTVTAYGEHPVGEVMGEDSATVTITSVSAVHLLSITGAGSRQVMIFWTSLLVVSILLVSVGLVIFVRRRPDSL